MKPEQLPSGKWRVTHCRKTPDKPNRSTKREYFDSEPQAWAFIASLEYGAKLAQSRVGTTLCKLVDEFLADKRSRGCKSLKDSERYVRRIIKRFGPHTQITSITTRSINAWRQSLRLTKSERTGRLMSPASINRHLAELRSMLRYAIENELIQWSDAPVVRLEKEPPGRQLKADIHDFQRIINHLPKTPHRAWMWYSFNTGQRLADVRMAKWSQIRDGKIYFGSSKTGRGPDSFCIQMLDQTRVELERLPRVSTYLFVNQSTGRPYAANGIRKALDTARRRAGVEQFTQHHIRHLATTVMLEATGGDLDLVQRLFGWADKTMAKRYGHVGKRAIQAGESLQNLVNSLPVTSDQAPRATDGQLIPFAARGLG